jgi:hypothetical protein
MDLWIEFYFALSEKWAVGVMGCRSNGLSELWAVGIMLRIRTSAGCLLKKNIIFINCSITSHKYFMSFISHSSSLPKWYKLHVYKQNVDNERKLYLHVCFGSSTFEKQIEAEMHTSKCEGG